MRNCPFCGGEAFVKQKTTKGALVNSWRVGCKTKNCLGNSNRYYDNKQVAITAWEQRPDEFVGFMGNNLIMILDGRPFVKSGVDVNKTNEAAGFSIPMIQSMK